MRGALMCPLARVHPRGQGSGGTATFLCLVTLIFMMPWARVGNCCLLVTDEEADGQRRGMIFLSLQGSKVELSMRPL